ncbi:MAG: BNR repeat-containing protein [Capsulimonadaceae bacterium]|nr:BNR repeat-containing protein [Capsulimonadaceae bacterium]
MEHRTATRQAAIRLAFPTLLAAVLLCFAAAAIAHSQASGATYVIEKVIDIAPVWSGHSVGFAMATRGDQQFAAFYDDQRRMTVASRRLSDTSWQLVRLPEKVAWDSHNYIAMTIDDDGYIHVSGNMHVVPLVYFRTQKPLDITTFERVAMVGRDEQHATYPDFFNGPNGALMFGYRDGRSGNGNQIYNEYDLKTRTWKRLLDKPLTDGQGHRNAYLTEPVKGPDGYFHVVWVWRESPLSETCHDLSYARSRDMIHWETSDGTPLSLPITLTTGEIVDPVPQKGGMLNGLAKLGFDAANQPVISYVKYDANGNTQIYCARKVGDHWKSVQVSDFNWRWDFSGGGSLPSGMGLSAVEALPDGTLALSYGSPGHGGGKWKLDAATFKQIGTIHEPPVYPADLRTVRSTFPGMQSRIVVSSGGSGEEGVQYLMRWETLGANRDQPRTGPLPEPSMLQVVKLRLAVPAK